MWGRIKIFEKSTRGNTLYLIDYAYIATDCPTKSALLS